MTLALALGTAASLWGQSPVVQTPAGKKALEKIRQWGGLALEIAQNDDRLEVSYAQSGEKISDEQLTVLKDLQGLIHLDLRGLPLSDAQTIYLKPLVSLQRLHLERTRISDKGLENLKRLTNLEYLNLYGTSVTNAGLTHLQGMKNLKHLYLWQTRVTPGGAARLKKVLPGLDVNLGIEEKLPDKPVDKSKDKR